MLIGQLGSNATSQFSHAQQNATRNARLTKEVEIIFDPAGGSALAKTVTHEYDLTYQFSTGVNETATNEYDYVVLDQTTAETIGISSGALIGLLKRRTEKTYLDATNAAYRDRNLLGMVASVTVKDGMENILAQTSIYYDEGGQYAQLNDYGSVTNWENPQTPYRGNPTTTSQWLNFDGSTLSTFPNGANLTTHAQYDQCGSGPNSWDAKGNISQVEYSNAYAYPTLFRSAVPDSSGIYGSTAPLVSTSIYDFNTGKIISTKDPNDKTTSYDYSDPLNRLRQVTMPDSGRIRYNYSSAPGDLYVQVLTDEDAARSIETRQYFDGMGRPTRVFLFDGTPSTPWSVTDTYYDNMGRISQVSNPYRVSSPSAIVPSTCSVCTTNAYDALGRVISVTTSDDAQMTTIYGALTSGSILGTTVLVTDQAGKKRRSLTDALGRLVRVDEPDKDTGSLGDVSSSVQPTSYTYDALGNLRLVTQGAQQRFFMYDSLGRLIRAKNPEQGNFTADSNGFPALTDTTSGISNSNWSTGYIYDENGNLTRRKDPRNIVNTYGYDGLNRNTTIDYGDTTLINPDITRRYDGATNGKGRLWESYPGRTLTVGSNVEHTKVTDYDALGRPKSQFQEFKTNGVWSPAYTSQRNYNLAGGVTSQIYPSGNTVNYNYDVAGRLGDKDAQNLAFTGTLGDGAPRTYSRAISYSPLGSMLQEQFGTDTAIYNKLAYNSRGQLAEIKESTTPNDSSWNRGKFVNWYSLACGGAACNAADNNGNLRKQETLVPNNEQNTSSTSWYQQYEYDSLNRLTEVHEHASSNTLLWHQSFVYDRFGNRSTNQSGTTQGVGINSTQAAVVTNTATNRLYGPGETEQNHPLMDYDAAGNQIKDLLTGNGTRTYDAENRLIIARDANGNQVAAYTYNADGQRVRRTVGGQPSAVETWQVYGMDGELLAEYAASAAQASPQKEYGYRNGQLLITAEAPTAARTNVARASNGGVVSYSSQETPYVGTFANDGEHLGYVSSQYTFWRDNTNGSFDDWLEIDFNGSKSIDEIDLYTVQDNAETPTEPTSSTTFGLYGITDFDVQYRNGSGWTTVSGGSVSGNNKVWKKLNFPAVTTTAIRVTIHNALANRSRIVEVEAWGTSALTSSMNVASVTNGASATAYNYTLDGVYPGYHFQSSFAIDGQRYCHLLSNGSDGTGFWRDEHGLSSWLEVDFSGSQTIAEIDVYTVKDYPALLSQTDPTASDTITQFGATAFEVQYWTGSAWVAMPNGSTTGNSLVWRKINFAPITTSKIRVVINAAIDGVARIAEVEAWTASSSANINWLVTDQLGTPRMIFDKTGTLANVKRHDYLPFGEELSSVSGLRSSVVGYAVGDTVRQKFTDKERDVETGLDFFGARYYSSTQGRFTSPDEFAGGPDELYVLGTGHPEKQALVYGDTTNPQSLNKYQYCFNNPLRFIDPDGHDPDGWLDKLVKTVDNVIGPMIRNLQSAIAGAPEEQPHGASPLYVGDEQVQRYVARKAQAVDRAYKILSVADLGPGGLAHGYLTGDKKEMAISAAGMLLGVVPELKPVSGAIEKLGLKILTNEAGVLTAKATASDAGKLFNLLRGSNQVVERAHGVFVAKSAFGKGYVTFRTAEASGSRMISVDFHRIQGGLRKIHFIR